MVLSVQYMRAIAALFVVMHHSIEKGAHYSTNPMGWFQVGDIGVDLFFIISGYIMCHATYNKEISFGKFLKARVIRIIPLYWVLTTVALVIYLVAPDKINSSGGMTSIIDSYMLIPSDSKYLIQNGWTLSYEFYFYFIFALGLSSVGIIKYMRPAIIIVFVATIGFIVSFNSVLINFLTNQLLLEFLFGVFIFLFFLKYKLNQFFSISLILSSIILLLLVNFKGGINIQIVDYGLPMVLLFIGMRGLEDTFINKQQLKISKLFEAIGNSSYSLYLIHPFALVAVSMILDKLGVTGYSYLFLIVLIVASLITGHACYLVLEKNLIKLSKNTKIFRNTKKQARRLFEN